MYCLNSIGIGSKRSYALTWCMPNNDDDDDDDDDVNSPAYLAQLISHFSHLTL